MRLIDADYMEQMLKESASKVSKYKKPLYNKMREYLKTVPTANPTCPECGHVLEGEARERQTANASTN